MGPLIRRLRRLGPTGAAANARRACAEHRMALRRADALALRLADRTARPAVGHRAAPARAASAG